MKWSASSMILLLLFQPTSIALADAFSDESLWASNTVNRQLDLEAAQQDAASKRADANAKRGEANAAQAAATSARAAANAAAATASDAIAISNTAAATASIARAQATSLEASLAAMDPADSGYGQAQQDAAAAVAAAELAESAAQTAAASAGSALTAYFSLDGDASVKESVASNLNGIADAAGLAANLADQQVVSAQLQLDIAQAAKEGTQAEAEIVRSGGAGASSGDSSGGNDDGCMVYLCLANHNGEESDGCDDRMDDLKVSLGNGGLLPACLGHEEEIVLTAELGMKPSEASITLAHWFNHKTGCFNYILHSPRMTHMKIC